MPWRRKLQYQALAIPILVAAAAPDFISQAWAEPIRKSSNIYCQQSIAQPVDFAEETPVPDVSSWGQSFIAPIKTTIVYADIAPFHFTPSTTIFLVPNDVGIHAERRIQYQVVAQPTFTPVVEVITPDKWFQELSTPIRLKSGLRPELQQFASIDPFILTQPEGVSEDKWHQPWSEPVRQKLGLGAALQQFFTIDPFILTRPEQVDESKWHQSWSEPVRIRPSLGVHLQSSLASSPFVEAAPVPDISSWHRPFVASLKTITTYADIAPFSFTTPTQFFLVPSSVGIQVEWRVQYQAVAKPAFVPAAEENTVDKWFISLSEPVRQKAGLLASLQQTTAIDPHALTQPETVTEDKWHRPWSEPVKLKQGLRTDLQQFIAPDPYPRPPEGLTTSNWYVPLSEPVRQKQGLRAQYQQFLAIDPFILTQPERVSEDRWHQPWSEPTRQKRGLGAYLQRFTTFDPYPVTPAQEVGSTSEDLSIQVKFKGVFLYQSYAAPTFTPPEVVTLDKWAYRWSEPVRQKRGLGAHLQHFIEPDPFPRPPQPTVFPGSWYEPLSEPVRQKRGLAARHQQFFTIDTALIPNPSKMMEGWFGWLAEPVRQKPGLRTALQQFKIQNDQPPTTFPVATVTISATETNNDFFLAAIKVYVSLPARRALVSIIEVPVPGITPTSVIES